jgi:type I restriction enzyme S subunit
MALDHLDLDRFDLSFVEKYLRFRGFRDVISGTSQPQIIRANIIKIQIPLPPLEEQKRIAGILDAADILRAKRREALAKLDDLLQSTFLDMFGDPVTNPKGWEVRNFGSLGNCRLGKMLDKAKQTGDCQYPYLANTKVKWGRFEMSELRQMDFNEADREEFKLEEGDLLICEGGEVGRCAIWREDKKDVFFQKALHRMRLDRSICISEYSYFFMYFMAMNGGFRDLTTSATIAHLTGVKLKKLPVPIPPLDLQKRFSEIVSSVEEQKTKMRKHLEQLDDLFASLQQRAFRGDL